MEVAFQGDGSLRGEKKKPTPNCTFWDFADRLGIKTAYFLAEDEGLIPGPGTKIPHCAALQKKKKPSKRWLLGPRENKVENLHLKGIEKGYKFSLKGFQGHICLLSEFWDNYYLLFS